MRKNTHKQKSTNKTKIKQQFFALTNFLEGESDLFYPCLQQYIDSNPSILFICILICRLRLCPHN